MSPETPNTTPAQSEQVPESAPEVISLPEGLISPEQQARVDEAMTTPEPMVDEAQQAIAQAELIRKQQELSQASAEAVHAAKTANAARRVDAA